ncbi:hypothetical protein CRUP_026426 [Coryphaenoides rupestris]|nr:hypothetical protein CRUP_026426 [Coryphaenoides rupestris]
MSDLTEVAVYSDPLSDIYKVREHGSTHIFQGCRGMFGACVMRLRGPSCGWGAVVVSAVVVFLVAALGLALVLILTRPAPTLGAGPRLLPDHGGAFSLSL